MITHPNHQHESATNLKPRHAAGSAAKGPDRSTQNPQSKIKNLLLATLAFIVITTSASALTPAELLTPELERQQISFAGLSDGMLSYFDADRRLTRQPVDRFVRLTFLAEQPEPVEAQETDADVATWMVELIDGQRIVGMNLGGTPDQEGLRFDTYFGELTIRLDDIRFILTSMQNAHTPTNDSLLGDVVQLDNGDRLMGFVVGIEHDGVSFQPDGTDAAITLQWERVALLSLANPSVPPAGDLDLITLIDQSRLRVDDLSIMRDRVAFRPSLADSAEPIEMEATQVQRVDFSSGGYRLVELVSQPMRTVDGGSAMGLELPPQVDGNSLRLHAPVTVVFDLPEGSRRFSANAALDLPGNLPPERIGWADVLLRVQVTDGDEALQPGRVLHLSGDDAARDALINVSIGDDATGLRIELDTGANGPILDRLRLRDAVLLIESTDAATPAE